jgi:hypothetical protein
MECERLVRLVKSWYLQVKDEALAPARMVAFMEKHVAECPVCMVDDGVRQEVDRITRIVLPPSKTSKPKTADDDEENESESEEEENTEETDEDSEGEEDEDEDEVKDDDIGEVDEDFDEDEDE